MISDILRLDFPATRVAPQDFEAAWVRYRLEPALGDRQPRAFGRWLEPEFDEGRWLLRNIYPGVLVEVVPSEGQQPLRLHALDRGAPRIMLITRIGHPPCREGTRDVRTIALAAEPLPKLAMIRQRAPDARNGCFQLDDFADAISHFRNLLVAHHDSMESY